MQLNHKIRHKVFKEEGREEGGSESSISTMLMAQLWAQSGGIPPQEAGETDSDSAIYRPHVASGQPTGLRTSSSIYGLSHVGPSGYLRGKWPCKFISKDPHVVHALASLCRF